MTFIKICGIKDKITALAAAQAGADYIGLIFASSPRHVSLETAQDIARHVKTRHSSTMIVGVFVNRPAEEVNHAAEVAHLDLVQLSGDEAWDYCAQINRPVVKAVRVGPGQGVDEVMAELARGRNFLGKKALYLLDSRVSGLYGGTGQTFDWSLAARAAREFPVILAGGLTPENVAEAVRQVKPWGVDVSTGVETQGAKDISKIKLFIRKVRECDGGKQA